MCLAIPTQVKTIDENGIATVELGGVEREVSLIMTPEAQVGDYVLVHTGYAITLMDEDEAKASLELFAELARIQEEMEQEAAVGPGPGVPGLAGVTGLAGGPDSANRS